MVILLMSLLISTSVAKEFEFCTSSNIIRCFEHLLHRNEIHEALRNGFYEKRSNINIWEQPVSQKKPTRKAYASFYKTCSSNKNKYKWAIENGLVHCNTQQSGHLQYTFVIVLVLLGLWTTLQLFIHIETIAVIENEAENESEDEEDDEEEEERNLLHTLFNDLYSEEERQDVENVQPLEY